MLPYLLTLAETSRDLPNDLYQYTRKPFKYTAKLLGSVSEMFLLSFIDTNDCLMIVIFMSSFYVLLTL